MVHTPIQFLYPTSRQYPIDAVCSEIVHALAARNFDVPGIAADFDTYGSGEQRMRYLSTATGATAGWRLNFGRCQASLPGARWSDCAAISSVTIPRKRLTVYGDNSPPSFYLYVGNDRSRDFAEFAGGLIPGVNSKLWGKPRTYLRYRGNYAGECRIHPRGAMLLHTDDLGREYGPTDDEPYVFDTAEVFTEFAAYLRDVVLAQILAHPEAPERVDLWPEPPAIPWPSNIGPLYCFADDRDVARIRQGQADKTEMPAHERWAMHGAGWRLASLDIPNDGAVPKVAYDGFTWCGLGEITDPGKLRIPGTYRHSDRHTLRVMPKRANDIYIADHGAMEARRAELAAAIDAEAVLRGQPARSCFTNEEMHDFVRARARTIVPITEYRGGFAEPVVLVNRELGFDEVEIIGGAA